MEISVLQIVLVVFLLIHAAVKHAAKRGLLQHMEKEDGAALAWAETAAPVLAISEQAPSATPSTPILPDAHFITSRATLPVALRESLRTPQEIANAMAVAAALGPPTGRATARRMRMGPALPFR